MNLYFKDSSGNERLIKSGICDCNDAMKYITKFCNERNFKIFYCRTWEHNGCKTFDVGSHSEFFHLRDNVGEIDKTNSKGDF